MQARQAEPSAHLGRALSVAIDAFIAAHPEPKPTRSETIVAVMRLWLAEQGPAPLPSDTEAGRAEEPRDAAMAQIALRVADGRNRLRAWREFRGMTAAELARRAEISQVFLWQIETKRRVGTLKTLQRIADALSITVSDMTDLGAEARERIAS